MKQNLWDLTKLARKIHWYQSFQMTGILIVWWFRQWYEKKDLFTRRHIPSVHKKRSPVFLYPPDGEHKQLIWKHKRTQETLRGKSALHEISTPCRHTPSPSAICTITKHLYNWSSSQWIYYYLSSKSHSRQSKHALVKQGSRTQKYFQKYEKHFYFLFKNLALR